MPESKSREQLIQEYSELQLHVTRFSAVQQELINTRDRLDQELERYKRLYSYNALALRARSYEEFYHTLCEAVVDVFEVESALVFIEEGTNYSNQSLFTEGLKLEHSSSEISSCIANIQIKFSGKENFILNHENLVESSVFKLFDSGIFGSFTDNALPIRLFVFGLNSSANSKLYNAIEDRHLTMFSVFMQQLRALVSNRKKNDQIEKQVEQIQSSQEELRKLSLIATKSKSGVIITDTFGKIEWVNEAFSKISGYELTEVIGKKPKDFLQGADSEDEPRALLRNALGKKEDVEVTIVNYNKEGKPYYNNLEIISVFNEKGEHTNFIALQKDITNEILFKQELVRVNSRFELIANQSKIGIWEFDPKSNQVIWSNVLFDIYGIQGNYSSMELQQLWREMIVQEDQEMVLDSLESLTQGKTNSFESEFRITRKDNGQIRTLKSLTVAERSESGEIIRLVGSSQDVTELKQLQLNLEGAINQRDQSIQKMNVLKDFYESILEHSPSEIMVFDENLHLSFSNIKDSFSASPWVKNNLKCEEDNCSECDKFVYESVQEAISKKKLVQVEDFYLASNDKEVTILRSVLPYFNEFGKFENLIVIGIDISELKSAQEVMAQNNIELKKINSELDNFVYSISHDLRSPLLSIKGIISLIIHTDGLDANTIQLLEMADKSVSRLDGTIQEILEYSRNSRLSVSLESFDLKEMVKTIFDDLKFSSSKPFDFKIEIEGTSNIYSDKARVGILLKNIIGNSVKYRREDVQSLVEVKMYRVNGKLNMVVADNGEGIAESHLDKIFNMFFRGTTASVGTGLGLYICKEIVAKLNGAISVHSELGIGTTMSIVLPIQTPNA